jgi:hypothetical protein
LLSWQIKSKSLEINLGFLLEIRMKWKKNEKFCSGGFPKASPFLPNVVDKGHIRAHLMHLLCSHCGVGADLELNGAVREPGNKCLSSRDKS